MCVLTIAVPIYNMERCLEKNLATFDDPRLAARVQVICLNNASSDSSLAIAEAFEERSPEIFQVLDRKTRGYGGSINDAVSMARGKYFRIVDADDWVCTDELVRFADCLESAEADIVYTDYRIVDMQTGREKPVRAGDKGAEYGVCTGDFSVPVKTYPMIHGTTYRTELLRECGFKMQDDTFFVDEEYMLLPAIYARTVLYLDMDIYRYMVSNPAQSTSPQNRSRLQTHQERVIKRVAEEFARAPEGPSTPFVRYRVTRLLGDRFVVLLMYVEDRKEGRRLAKQWEKYVRSTWPDLWPQVSGKARILYLLNAVRLPLGAYLRLKEAFLG